MKYSIFFFLCLSLNSVAQREIKIGNQIWRTDNLNVDRFRNGDLIPEAKTDEEWEKASENKQPAWCYYNNDPVKGVKYGKLYNWYAVNDKRGLAPEGWHIPSEIEWTMLIDFLGGEKVAEKKIKTIRGWESLDSKKANGPNSSVFSGLRNNHGDFSNSNEVGWWSSTEYYTSHAHIHFLNNINGITVSHINPKGYGLSIRCLRDKLN